MAGPSIEEALAVLRNAASSPRAKAALRNLESELVPDDAGSQPRAEERGAKPSGGPPDFQKVLAREMFSGSDSARGESHSPDEKKRRARGRATAQRGATA